MFTIELVVWYYYTGRAVCFECVLTSGIKFSKIVGQRTLHLSLFTVCVLLFVCTLFHCHDNFGLLCNCLVMLGLLPVYA
uniref:Uncharacterized protein n=1 Tax=Arundo donax TaxID=35708 RepID=A0A0A9EUG8_ARUDO